VVKHRSYVYRIDNFSPACGSSCQCAIEIVTEGVVDVQDISVCGKQLVPELRQQTSPSRKHPSISAAPDVEDLNPRAIQFTLTLGVVARIRPATDGDGVAGVSLGHSQ
jgi:hypothetical protein